MMDKLKTRKTTREVGTITTSKPAGSNAKSVGDKEKHIKCRTYPVSKNGATCEYMGYIFTRDGEVCSPRGRFIRQIQEEKNTGNHVSLIVKDPDGKRRIIRVNLARAIYCMFSGDELQSGEVITFKNGNSYNCSFDNLVKGNLNGYFAGLHHIRSSGRKRLFSETDVQRIKKEYHSRGFNYKQLGARYNCSAVTIQKIICGTYFTPEKVVLAKEKKDMNIAYDNEEMQALG